jgi:hypothetical protein
MTSYGEIDRLMMSLLDQIVILNGSDSRNTTPNGNTVFESTQRVGRLSNIKLKTRIKDNNIDKMATYTFTLKEIV